MALKREYFDTMFQGNDDPWSFQSRWYEERKRALTLSSLPLKRYKRAYEPGCANGELSAGLASLCDELTCTDGSSRAVELAQKRLAGQSNATVAKAWVPDEWPDGSFDLIVISELGYFLTPEMLSKLASKVNGSLATGGTIVACHWRRAIEGCDLDGNEVHERLGNSLTQPHAARWVDEDFLLDVWFGDGRSVGYLEGLVNPPP
jgi:SAM-dependent methyltransferase